MATVFLLLVGVVTQNTELKFTVLLLNGTERKEHEELCVPVFLPVRDR